MSPFISILIVLVIIGVSFFYLKKYPLEAKLVEIPALQLAKPDPLILEAPLPLRVNTKDTTPLQVTTTGLSIPLKGPERIDLTLNKPLTIDYGNPPEFHMASPINFGPPPALKVSEIPPLKVNPLTFTEPPLMKISPTTLQVAQIPPLTWSELPKMQFGELPKIQFGELPPFGEPCMGYSGTRRDVGAGCWSHMFKNAGCLADAPYDDFHRYKTKDELFTYASNVAKMASNNTKAQCFGPTWTNHILADIASVVGGFQHGWRWCKKCSCIYIPYGVDICPAGGQHVASWWARVIEVDKPVDPIEPFQNTWRWCSRCSMLVYEGSKLGCFDKLEHNFTNSKIYILHHTNAPSFPHTAGFRWCQKCGILNNRMINGACFMGDLHDNTRSADYMVGQMPIRMD